MEAGTSGANGHERTNDRDSSQSTVEIKIKTLDSQVYTCQVERNMPVPDLKEQIASLTGVPVENQRLICRGKVLKDDHLLSAYGVEDGHTLHLVTRQAPQPSPSSTTGVSRNDGAGEDEGRIDPQPGASRGRPGQVSHSVVLGTFNIPDHGDGGMPDVSRIISSVLNSLGISNLVPVNAGVSNSGSVTATILPGEIPQQSGVDDQGRAEAGSDRQQTGIDLSHQTPSLDQGGSREMEALLDSVHGLRPGGGFIGTMPASVPQIRLVQQAMVVPDALSTMSQYLNRMEQVFAANGQQTLSSSSAHILSSGTTMRTDQLSGYRGYPTPEALGAIVRRTQELLNNQAGPELARLASQLENNANFHDAAVRGDVQSAALRDGTMMQHLGALLLELGRTTLTLRVGSSPAESVVNAGPAVFISATGPNPMMVQPLPFQAGTGIGGLMPQPTVGAMGPAAAIGDAPRNINIHIHAGDLGLPSSLLAAPQASPAVSQSMQSGTVTSGPSLGSGTDADAVNRGPSVSNSVFTQATSGSIQGGPVGFGEHGAVRVLPMRTLVAAVPAALHARPPTDATGATVGVFYPLLARFQQLNPAQLSQQAAFINGGPIGQSVPSASAVSAQQQSPFSTPTVRTQVQAQAWVPSGGQVLDGQGMSRPVNFEGMVQLPLIPSASETALVAPQQQRQRDGTESMVDGQSLLPPVQSTSNVEMAADAAVSNRVQISSGAAEDETQAGGGVMPGIDVTGLVRPILQQVVEAYQQAGARRADHFQPEQVHVGNEPVVNEPVTQVDKFDDLGRDDGQEPKQEEGVYVSMQNMIDVEHEKQAGSNSRGIRELEGLPVQTATNPVILSSSRELPKGEENSKPQENGSANVPVGLGLGGLQPLPSRTHKRSNKQSRQQHSTETGTSDQGVGGQATHSMCREDGQVATSNRGQNVLHNLMNSLTSRSEGTDAAAAQTPQGLFQLLNSIGSSVRTPGGSSGNIGEVISQVMTNQPLGNLSHGARNATDQGVLSSSSFGGMMGQLLQSPFMGNVLQQVMEQIGDEPQGFENMLNGQSGPDFSGLFQQVMPVVSRALARTSGSGSEFAARPENDVDPRSLDVTGATQDADLVHNSDGREQPLDQDELQAQLIETVSAEQEQSTDIQRPTNEVYPGGAPVPKRQKMDLEGIVKKLEQDDSSEEIVRSLAETAAHLMEPIQSAEADPTDLAQHLSQTEGIANEYMSLLFRDLRGRVAADPEFGDGSELLRIFQVLKQL